MYKKENQNLDDPGYLTIGEYEPYPLTQHGKLTIGFYGVTPPTVHGLLTVGIYLKRGKDNSLFFSGD